MDSSGELSSSFSFVASSCVTNGSCASELGASPDNLSLTKLSSNLERLLADAEFDYADALIVVDGKPVGVHRCILAARSPFFHDLFKNGTGEVAKEGKPKYHLSDMVSQISIGYETFNVILNYMYTGKLKASPAEVSTCVYDVCTHDACRPAIDYAVELMYACVTFQMKELVPAVKRRLFNFVEKALVEDVIPVILTAFNCQLTDLRSHCVQRIARSDLDKVSLEKELPDQVSTEIISLRKKFLQEIEPTLTVVDPLHERRIGRIHKALDSDDIELVKLLLDESKVTLDDAFALHYAVAYCDPKIVKELLSMRAVTLDHRNSRGYTVLHVAARRKEPSIIIALLANGARAALTAMDGQTAVTICRMLTRPKDYNENTKQGQESNKSRLCIDVLQREMRRSPLTPELSISSPVMADDFQMRLDYLENRVAFAQLLFPSEARLAKEIGREHAALLLASKGFTDLRSVDLNESPDMKAMRLVSRMEALQKTVETGRRYFPLCSEVIDKFLEDDMPDIVFLEKGSAEEKKIKKRRFIELKDDVQKAFNRDMAQKNHASLASSSSSSSSLKDGVNGKFRKK
ncbi:hypothetical protein QQ045_001490 [Rhodiola kirilowii]